MGIEHRTFNTSSWLMRQSPFVSLVTLAAAGVTLLCCATPAETPALRLPDVEGSTHGFPILRDINGRKLADGEFTQWVEKDRLRIKITYDFVDEVGAASSPRTAADEGIRPAIPSRGHRVEEIASFLQTPGLIQEDWSWTEVRAGAMEREFRIAFGSGQATAQKRAGSEVKRWSKLLKIEPGRTFAGFGFTLALESLRRGLLGGQKFELRAIGFTPQPRLVSVEISYAGIDRVAMGNREIDGDCFVIHPKIPLIARAFVQAPDTRIWLIRAPPIGFLRWQGPLVEPSDAVIRVDLLAGEPAAAAAPGHRK